MLHHQVSERAKQLEAASSAGEELGQMRARLEASLAECQEELAGKAKALEQVTNQVGDCKKELAEKEKAVAMREEEVEELRGSLQEAEARATETAEQLEVASNAKKQVRARSRARGGEGMRKGTGARGREGVMCVMCVGVFACL